VSKVCNIQMARLAVQCMLGKKLSELGIKQRKIPHFGVKEAVFPFNMFRKWTRSSAGNALDRRGAGMANSFGLAFYKSQEAAKQELPLQGTVLMTVTDADKKETLKVAREFQKLGFRIKATEGTYKYLTADGVKAEQILKMHEGRPNIVDAIKNGEIQLVINTPAGRLSVSDDSYIRKAAIKYKLPYITTTAAAAAAVKGIAEARNGKAPVRSLQSYHAGIK